MVFTNKDNQMALITMTANTFKVSVGKKKVISVNVLHYLNFINACRKMCKSV